MTDAELVDEVGRAELAILPYHEMHNSGAILVAMSLGRPVLAPRTASNTALSEEVGPGWIIEYDGELTPEIILSALDQVRHGERSTEPDLAGARLGPRRSHHRGRVSAGHSSGEAAMTATVERSLGASASRGASVTILGQVIRVVVQLAGIMVLARLLTPTDYGLLAMVTAIIGVGELVRDFGLSSAAIQARTLSRGQKSNLFWINTSIGLSLTLITIAASWLVAGFYGDDPPPADHGRALGDVPPQRPLDAVPRRSVALLRFGRLVVVDTTAQVIALAVGLGLAFAGAGYWSLVGQAGRADGRRHLVSS